MVYPSATIGRVAQADESNAHRHQAQFDCSYSWHKAELILKPSALSQQPSARISSSLVPAWLKAES
jgi:hypothetical protein